MYLGPVIVAGRAALPVLAAQLIFYICIVIVIGGRSGKVSLFKSFSYSDRRVEKVQTKSSTFPLEGHFITHNTAQPSTMNDASGQGQILINSC